MTDRIKGIVVTLDRDYRDDDVPAILNAIRMIKGVVAVAPKVSTSDDWMARRRVQHELRDKIYAIMDEFFDERSPDNGGKDFKQR